MNSTEETEEQRNARWLANYLMWCLTAALLGVF